MASKNNKIKTVSQKITESFLPQDEIDPENDPESLVQIADFDDDFGDFVAKPSEIRKRNVKLLSDFSEKYKGKVTSRQELDAESEDIDSDNSDDSELKAYRIKLTAAVSDDDSDEKDEDAGSECESDEAHANGEKSIDSSDDSIDEENSEDDDDSENDQDSDYASSAENQDQNSGEDETRLMVESNQNAEIQKGLAVQSQLKIWEKLLEVRIHSQKMLTKANSLPEPGIFNQISAESTEFAKLAKETSQNVQNLLENMLDMQRTLASQYSEITSIFKSTKKRPSATGKVSSEPPIKRYAVELQSTFDSLTPYRNSVLRKWDDRTKILTPGAVAKKGGGKSLSDNFDVIRKIEAVLLNRNDLLAKSQTVKGTYRLFGQKDAETANSEDEDERMDNGHQTEAKHVISGEIYDDTDFYHQQLRELIEYKSNTTSNPHEMSKQFAELQKLRQKMKKKVDTRASKGRKIRYVVHNKLVNFMAPNPNSEWTEESKSELYRSLFAT